jgi:hypothetical protein
LGTPLAIKTTACWPDYPFRPPTLFPGDYSLPAMLAKTRNR